MPASRPWRHDGQHARAKEAARATRQAPDLEGAAGLRGPLRAVQLCGRACVHRRGGFRDQPRRRAHLAQADHGVVLVGRRAKGHVQAERARAAVGGRRPHRALHHPHRPVRARPRAQGGAQVRGHRRR